MYLTVVCSCDLNPSFLLVISRTLSQPHTSCHSFPLLITQLEGWKKGLISARQFVNELYNYVLYRSILYYDRL